MSAAYTDEVILKPIGTKKSGYTIPEPWRKKLNIDQQYVRAKLKGNTIVIEPMSANNLEWDTKVIELNQLNDETIEMVKTSHQNYLAGYTESFVTLEDFKNEL
jgi:bifunctional DNA-binding transcriptional regulator/antitoxin component of YhaV-PrlF toxin-antitoxin module